jgi:APA family basic amino acid/polyamine antiporter
MIPSAGAYYVVARTAFGDYVSFVVGWTDSVSLCGAMATIAILAGEYIGNLVPRFGNHSVSIAMSVVLLLALLQVRGIRWGSRFQDVATAITAFVFLSLIIGAFLFPHHMSQPALAGSPMPRGMALVSAWILVL